MNNRTEDMSMRLFKLSTGIAFAGLVVAPTLAGADGPTIPPSPPASNELQDIVDSLPDLTPKAFPAVFGVPSAASLADGTIGLDGGSGFVALTLVDPRDGIDGNDTDGDLAVGYTVGSAAESVALTFGVGITSLDGFGDDGSFFLNASREVASTTSSASYIGLQAGNLLAWGDAKDGDETLSAQFSHLQNFSAPNSVVPVQFTVGYGTDNTTDDDGSGDLDDGFFAGVGVGIAQNLSGSVSFNETQVNLGVGFSFPSLPQVGFAAGVFDVSDNTDRQQFSFTAAFNF